MCNSQQSKSTEKAQNKTNVDGPICGTKVKLPKQESSLYEQNANEIENIDGSIQLKFKMPSLAPTSTESSHSWTSPIPFSKTFGKSETFLGKQAGKIRLSLDGQQRSRSRVSDRSQPLRRRARSSEGYILKYDRIDSFGEDSHFDATNSPEQKRLLFSPLPRLGIKLRKNRNLYPRNKDQNIASTSKKSGKVCSRSVIPLEHPFKIVWDIFTVILSVVHSYLTHMAIRDRRFEPSPFISFCQAWFLVDILLNFFTERKTNTGEIISNPRRIVARYLTSWFAVDLLSLFPWELLYVKPLIEIQNRRGFFKKSFFRSKAVVRVTKHLRGKHFRWFGTVAKHTKHHGIGGQRLLRLIIKYVPKYVMFFRNMKGVVAFRILRFVHWSRRSMKNIESKQSDASTKSMSTARGDDDKSFLEDDENSYVREKDSFEVVYDWEKINNEDDHDEDDDGVPL